MKIVITSDLHYDERGHLTSPGEVQEMVQKIAIERPSLVILAGDLSHGSKAFEGCLAAFRPLRVPLAVLAGNHDIWKDDTAGFSSEELWSYQLESITMRQRAIWLEKQNMVFGAIGVVGSMAWYDYSGVDPSMKTTSGFLHALRSASLAWCDYSDIDLFQDSALDILEPLKVCFNNDATWIDWGRKDRDFASELRQGMLLRLRTLAQQEDIQKIVVVTHVPIVEEQMERKPDDSRWGLTNAYFGHLTLGAEVIKEPKVVAIISGHTHIGKQATLQRPGMPSIDVRVVEADYGMPGYTVLLL
jgi:predicted MPP superfamily phosphohydrolase